MSEQSSVLEQANQWLAAGVPYSASDAPYSGSITPELEQVGADCSRFIQDIFSAAGVNLPRTTEQQVEYGTPVALNDIQPGDVVYYDTPGDSQDSPNHTALYIGNGETIQETTYGSGTQEEPLNSEPIVAVRDFFTDQTGTASATTPQTSDTILTSVQKSSLTGSDLAAAHQMLLVVALCLVFIFGLTEVAGMNHELGTASIMIILGLFMVMGYQYYSRGASFLSSVFAPAATTTSTGTGTGGGLV